MKKWIVVIGLLVAVLGTTAVVPSSSDARWGCGSYGGYYPGYSSSYSYYPAGYGYGCGSCWGGFGRGGLGWGGYGRAGYGWGGYRSGLRLGVGMGYGGGW